MNFLEISNRSFSPRDYQTELLSHAFEENIIACLPSKIAKEFVALKLIQELSNELRRSKNRKISLYLTSSTSAFNLIFYLTDLKVKNINGEENVNWNDVLKNYQVILLEVEQCLNALESDALDLGSVSVLVIDDCHFQKQKKNLSKIFQNYYKNSKHKPKILGLAGALHSASCLPGRLGAEIEYLEGILDARAETASDIVTVLRYSPKPIEIIVECLAPIQDDPTCYIRNLMQKCVIFIKDHRYDPTEIYADEYKDELESMPDPKKEPLKCIEQFLLILDELGVYGADKAAYLLIIQIEKLKVKTPYERHYLLFCFIFTALVQIRSFCDIVFNKELFENDMDKINTFASPKFLRLVEVLEIFKPEKKKAKIVQSMTKEGVFDVNFEQINTLVISAGEKIAKIGDDLEKLKKNVRKINGENDTNPSFKQHRHHRKYRKKNFNHRVRNHNQNHGESEMLCGLIFCESTITAKTLFCLLCEVSRHHPNLSFLNTQYTVDKTINPVTDLKDAEAEHRKQEEVLKKFRMHECNLLITTSVLEEGFDLPKCNLVIRFNQPESYRSYVQCKGRAKASAALHVIMVSPKTLIVSSDYNHRYVCDLLRNTYEQHNDVTKKYDCIKNTKQHHDSDISHDKEKSNTELESLKEKQEMGIFEPETKNSECVESHLSPNQPCAVFEKIEVCTQNIINKLAEYMEIEKTLIEKCANKEPPISETAHADLFTKFIKAYQPSDGAQVNLSTAIALLNKYCSKLPSDTFTKLVTLWRCCKVVRNGITLYQYTIRLPLNCPLKHDIYGIPMITRTLARRVAAITVCKVLHEIGELDDNLLPIGKEGFKAIEEDWQFFELDKADEELSWNDQDDPRPGTTKRRQYYYKRIASALSNCRPTETSIKVFLYHIAMTLQCPIPDEQNTRGRKIYSPENAIQSFGILTTKKIPKISAFPIFTRSGEVKVSLKLKKSGLVLSKDQLDNINNFINYTFTSVLRLRKYLMLFDPEANENSFFVVPVKRMEFKNGSDINVDWDFLEVIKQNANTTPQYVNAEIRKTQPFDFNTFQDSVVMPWYRNQDQPQYFYVAEICRHLTPESSFPGENYTTFAEYYHRKYGIEIQNKKQPLLDVDHTSARLNFLTPRYVNRKGVALPTSSEETKRAKRENLEQKQILVPELCTVHPFPASLWRAAVSLPCILYRINALLLADEIRMEVSSDLGLGTLEVSDDNFEWPMLNFGWTLADVLKKAREDRTKNAEANEKEEIVNGIEENVEAEKSANDLLEEANIKAKNEYSLEIGTWSNEMAQNINDDFDEDDDELGILPKNLEICSSRNIRYGSPTSWDATFPKFKQQKNNNQDNFISSDSDDDDEFQSDNEDCESICDQNENNDDEYGLKIEFKNDHLAEAFESEEKLKQRQRNFNLFLENKKEETLDGFNLIEEQLNENIVAHEKAFEDSLMKSKNTITKSKNLIKANEKIASDIRQGIKNEDKEIVSNVSIKMLIPYVDCSLKDQLSLNELYEMNSLYQKSHPEEEFEVVGSGDFFDHFSDRQNTKIQKDKKTIKFLIENNLKEIALRGKKSEIFIDSVPAEKTFGFDFQPDLNNHPGPSPSIILQALTMSNANDGINLERLETIGDSFLKYAITTYLYCTYENVNEGKLSYLRSKQVSNLNLYRLGKKKILGESMIATKFEPQDNWLPPCYFVPKKLEQALIDAKIPICYWNLADLPDIKKFSSNEICDLVKERAKKLELDDSIDEDTNEKTLILATSINESKDENPTCYIPYNLVTQHSIPDKSIADCVEALIGAYLIDCGPRGALLFMAWLGIRVLPVQKVNTLEKRIPGSTRAFEDNGESKQMIYGYWRAPKTPLIRCIPDSDESLEILLDGFDKFEEELNYKFKDRSYLLQAMTHASYTPNRLTDCYQRLEFLGDAVLDYLITRHLYDDARLHSPGALTDLRSALVNNTIFASLAVRHGFHKYFRHLSGVLNDVIDRFVRIQVENNHCINEEYYLLSEDECNESEDVEVPKALGDIFESIAGAIFLDSNMSLDAVWKVYFRMMEPEIEQFSKCVPKSPIRELLELEPETAKFGKPEKLADGRRVRVTVEVFGKGIFRGIGRNYRIAKCTAAKCALRQLKKYGGTNKKLYEE